MQSEEHNELISRIAQLRHDLGLAESHNERLSAGRSRRQWRYKFAKGADFRHSLGEEHAGSNPHVDRRRKRAMRIRLENPNGQRMLRRRQRDIYEGELDTERIIALNDLDFDAQFASTDSGIDHESNP